MITRWYEIVCDACGCASHHLGNIQTVEAEFRSYSGIITYNEKHYCDDTCYRKSKNKKEIKNDS